MLESEPGVSQNQSECQAKEPDLEIRGRHQEQGREAGTRDKSGEQGSRIS